MSSAAQLRVAFFGGSFDPPHLGHLAAARAAQSALALDRVLFAPVGTQPLKPDGASASFEDRVAMTRLAIAGEPGFEVSLLDSPRPLGQPNYTLDTLRTFRLLNPATQLFLLLGADSFALLRNWRGAAEIPFIAAIVVVSRPGQHVDDVARFLPAGVTVVQADGLPEAGAGAEIRTYTLSNSNGETAPFYLLPDLYVPISASQVRAQTRAGAPSPLPPAVADYIREHQLYH